MEFEPEVFKQMAGLILMYDTDNYLYLHVSYDEDIGKCITLLKAENKKPWRTWSAPTTHWPVWT